MPWSIEERDGKFCVVKDDDGETEGCHDTRDAAERQRRALYASDRSLPAAPELSARALPNAMELLEAEGDGSLATIAGRAALWDTPTLIDSVAEGKFIERVKRGAFANAIEADRERSRLLYEHGTHPRQGRLPLGPLEELTEDDLGFSYRGKLLDTEFNREILPGLKAGLFGSSFLGKFHYGDPDYPRERSDYNPDRLPELTIVKVRPLIDVGPTAFPAYMGTVTSARSMTDELVFRNLSSGEALEKFAEWAKDAADPKIPMPVKLPASDPEPAQPVGRTTAEPSQERPAEDTTPRKETDMSVDLSPYTSREKLVERLDSVKARVNEIGNEFNGRSKPANVQQEFDGLFDEAKAIQDRIDYLDGEERKMQAVLGGRTTPPAPTPSTQSVAGERDPEDYRDRTWQTPKSRVPENVYDIGAYRLSARSLEDVDRLMVDGARRAIEIEDYPNPILTKEQAQTNVERLMTSAQGNPDDLTSPKTLIARHILATGSTLYRQAFGKYMRDQTTDTLSAEEHRALVSARALSLTGASGGFAVPFELDPTILGTSNGTINFVRQISRVENITVDEWRGITSAGITAAYAAEATETTDNAPTLVQPTVSTEKAQAFVPFSIEIGMDWDGLQTAISGALSDAKDELEASKFISGTGTNEPFGVLTGTTNTVNAAAGQTFTLANLYALLAALPPRYRSRGAFMGNLLVANRIRQFDTSGGAALWVTLGDDVPDRLLGRPFYESSDMADVATSVKFLLFGDFSRFLIVDRIGLSVDLIPHIVGTNHRPTGQRGIYAYWRNGSKVLDANAFRALIGVV